MLYSKKDGLSGISNFTQKNLGYSLWGNIIPQIAIQIKASNLKGTLIYWFKGIPN